MTPLSDRHAPSSRPVFLPPRTFLGFALAALAIVLITAVSYQSLQSRSASAALVRHTSEVISGIDNLLGAFKDIETGQRGFLLTGEERYLEPYHQGRARLASELEGLARLTADNPEQQGRLRLLKSLGEDKLAEVDATIFQRRAGQAEAALAVVKTDRGRTAMQQIRRLVDEMKQHERNLLEDRQSKWLEAAATSLYVQLGGAGLLLVLVVLGAVLASRDHHAREVQNWLRAGQTDLAERLTGDLRLEDLAENAIGFLCSHLEAPVGTVYARVGDDFPIVASRGRDDRAPPPLPAAALIRQTVTADGAVVVRDVPDDYFHVQTSLGRSRTRALLLAPACVDRVTHAVIELGFFREVRPADVEFIDRVAEMLAIAIRSAKDRSQLEALLEETQRQAEELQTQQEELRVNNEELEEQSRLTRQAHTLLEAQQTELEQSNAQLEEQAQMLEAQTLDLTEAQAALQARATELERANQHKSDFLANMSHELRTPLNSTLILSRLLADNRSGNLSEEEVKFAETISSAGNDLLALINDILDLSKIEAGKLELVCEPTDVVPLLTDLADAMGPVARAKGLGFDLALELPADAVIDTDRQRLAQILKNLVSNAIKFTEQGHVELHAKVHDGQRMAFSITDTGIGLPAHQHEVIFEAFRQADGSTHRRYGGTGLGLSISRDLARRLGGDILVHSEEGKGSTFVLTLPLRYQGPLELPVPAPAPPPVRVPPARPAPPPATAVAGLPDDRENLGPDRRIILAVEDDPAFAGILRDLIREMGFDSVLAHTAQDGLAAAERYAPHAILLDVNLPDLSGLGVLDQLKRNPRTRHIPVHMISVADYSREALERGAVGYALKPVKREALKAALQRLEAKFSQEQSAVLVIEDDPRQLESMRLLLQSPGTRVVGVETAGDALQRLATSRFDCIVMDLNLPDLSGYQLLERLAKQQSGSFPPVIVYTGRSLSREEEAQLRKYSDSIIVKGARSPERLLDEVTLFLHQVESSLPPESQRMLKAVRERDEHLEDRRILVVEDDERNIFALTSVLEPKGARVEVARNGREALERLQRRSEEAGDAAPYDLVLMDIMMPEMDGFTAMREIRKNPAWARLPIIALTAKAMRDDQEQCIAAGANDFIAKPLDVDRLLSLARIWIAK
ncbi:response regulator [Arenimonas sp. MALMAid1274]|uniref:response regulator n=1 Tax=Arenimonas sp. MALMAid1274 TaxID=3411630 RepID=UPI003B9EC073